MASATTDTSGAAVISAVPRDVIETHILSRLDGLTLAVFSSTSSYFHSLSSHDTLWRKICVSTWPSIDHPRVLQLISQFSNGHRGFFSDSFPLIFAHDQLRNLNRPSLPSELISAVDLWYDNRLIFSRVLETKTGSLRFQRSPFRVDLFDPKGGVPTGVKIDNWDDDTWRKGLEENLTLSWIIIDPTRKRAANISTLRPVSSEKHWLTGEVRLEFGPVMGCDRVELGVTCGGGRADGELHVREACMQVEDMDGKWLNGKDSLWILVKAMEFGERRRSENEGRKRHGEYLERKRRRRERKVSVERVLDMLSVVGLIIFVGWSSLLLFGR